MCLIIYYDNIKKYTIYLQFPLLCYAHYILSSNLFSYSIGHTGTTCEYLRPSIYKPGLLQGTASEASLRNSIRLPTLNAVLHRKWWPIQRTILIGCTSSHLTNSFCLLSEVGDAFGAPPSHLRGRPWTQIGQRNVAELTRRRTLLCLILIVPTDPCRPAAFRCAHSFATW